MIWKGDFLIICIPSILITVTRLKNVRKDEVILTGEINAIKSHITVREKELCGFNESFLHVYVNGSGSSGQTPQHPKSNRSAGNIDI